MGNKLFNDNCINILKTIPSESIDLIVTDPPYLITARGSSKDMGGFMAKKKLALNGKIFEDNDINCSEYLYEFY